MDVIGMIVWFLAYRWRKNVTGKADYIPEECKHERFVGVVLMNGIGGEWDVCGKCGERMKR